LSPQKTSRTRPCNAAITKGRLKKAQQFYEAAETVRGFADDESDVGDAYVTLCVHAGIAAADSICCMVLGEHAQGDDHVEAVALIKRVRPGGTDLGSALNTLLGFKTRAGYSAEPVNATTCKRARRAAEKLVTAARDRSAAFPL
jgi:hypothetical protein